ncbi:MAG TPA: glycoside hydrolase family 36 protein [Microbacterium sp.]|uniref:glycoside hydrolase family 36 protein n=1 Tax=Microbacterium sp. TaxID=51671 RepID=UPI002C9D9CD3|nr:glycoside hydrolase family 36 protein [Microbacterium sp.]HWI30079.1 glycoside hydrolase family 36 protein [Microbacterium sp.]
MSVDVPIVGQRERAGSGPFCVEWSADGPAALTVDGSGWLGRTGTPLVEVFVAGEQRARTSQAYTRSAIGARLRVCEWSKDDDRVALTQRDEKTGLLVRTVITAPAGTGAVRIESTLQNDSAAPLTVTAVVSASFGIAHSEAEIADVDVLLAASEWLAENRWERSPLRRLLPELSLGIHAQDGRGHFGQTSHGTWSTGENLPVGVMVHRDGTAFGWQVETSAGWHVDLSQGRVGAVLSLLGPTESEHQFARRLLPGESFDAVPVALTVSSAGADGAFAELTRYRRWLRRAAPEHGCPIVYNDFMNTLMGNPTTEALMPLIAAAAEIGAEVFCIDAGWFADPSIGDWWATVGEWEEATGRFSGGLTAVVEEIHARGMRSGIWLEPEVVGVQSPAARSLPEAAFFHRFGERVQEHERFHLDLRHPAARAHLDEVVDRLVRDRGVSYLKLDYNINAGVGTDDDATAPGDGLLGHTRALRDWLVAVQERHPRLVIENCSSGAMRADYALLAVTHLQSTSDQQDHLRYPPIAASAPASILPEQCGNWAYPAPEMTDEETAFTLVTGLSGRLYLSGFLNELRPTQRALVADAVAVHRLLRDRLPAGIPFWPCGLPSWEDDVVVLGMESPEGTLLFIWDRGVDAAELLCANVYGRAEQVFPAAAPGWTATTVAGGLRVRTSPGVGARVYQVRHPGDAEGRAGLQGREDRALEEGTR